LFIGRYNKYSRELSQTPWLIDGVRKSELSVEELLSGEINKHFHPTGMYIIVRITPSNWIHIERTGVIPV